MTAFSTTAPTRTSPATITEAGTSRATTPRAATAPSTTDRRFDDAFTTTLDAYITEAPLASWSDLLAERADSGDVDVVWSVHETMLGRLLLAFRGKAVVRVAFENEGFDAVVDSLGQRLGRRTLRSARPASELRRQLDAYLAGTRRSVDVPHDLVLSSAPFRRTVQESLASIPYGTTTSYAELANATGRPRAVRAVGSACATNPLPLVLPCHRVVRSDGGLGNYLGGVTTKERLLALEAERP